MYDAQSIPTAQIHRCEPVDYGFHEPETSSDRLPTWAAGFCIVLACSVFWVGALTILSWIVR